MPVVTRSYVAGNFLLKLDGADTGFVKSIDGGAIHADVIDEPGGASFFVKKHIGPPKYEEFAVQTGWWMGKTLYEWIAASWKMNYQRKNGSIVAYDVTLEARSEREFLNALITEVRFPALDGASKEQVCMTVKFGPELIRHKKASGTAAMPLVKAAQEMWLAANFRLEIDGLDCTKVTAVDSFTVRQTGEHRQHGRRARRGEGARTVGVPQFDDHPGRRLGANLAGVVRRLRHQRIERRQAREERRADLPVAEPADRARARHLLQPPGSSSSCRQRRRRARSRSNA